MSAERRHCACGSSLGLRNKSGKCRSCFTREHNANPEMRRRMKEGQDAYFDKPGVREAYAARIGRHIATMSDEERERRREHGRVVLQGYLRANPGIAAKFNSPEAKRKAGRSRTETVLAWCPPHMRDDYRALRTKLGAAEARAVMEADIPGTVAYARRQVANRSLGMRLRQEREKAQAY